MLLVLKCYHNRIVSTATILLKYTTQTLEKVTVRREIKIRYMDTFAIEQDVFSNRKNIRQMFYLNAKFTE